MLRRLVVWFAGDELDPALFLTAAAAGVALGMLLASLREQSALLERVYILAHEQRRLTIAAAQRDLANAGAAKERQDNG